MAGGVQFD